MKRIAVVPEGMEIERSHSVFENQVYVKEVFEWKDLPGAVDMSIDTHLAEATVKGFLAQGAKIEAIKFIREYAFRGGITCGLKEAKEFVESL